MKNYTTKISASKTVGEIQELLAKFGIRKISLDYDGEGHPTAITFVIETENEPRLIFCIEADASKVLAALKKDKKTTKAQQNLEHAKKVAWRITKELIEIKLSYVEMNLATIEQEFLPYLVLKGGQTMYDYISSIEGKQMLLQESTEEMVNKN